MAAAAATTPSADSASVGAAEDDGDGPVGEQRAARPRCASGSTPPTSWRGRAGEQRRARPRPRRRGGAGAWRRRASETEVRCGGQLDDRARRRSTTAWRRRRNRTGSSSLRSGASSSTVPPGAQTSSIVARGQAEHDLGGQAVAELGVDVVGAEHALGELGPGVGVLVGEPGAAEHARPGRRRGAPASAAAAAVERLAPRRPRASASPCADQRRAEAVVAVDRLEAEAALVAEPAPVHRVDVDALVPQDLVAARLHERCGSRPSTWCRWSRPGRGPTGGP